MHGIVNLLIFAFGRRCFLGRFIFDICFFRYEYLALHVFHRVVGKLLV